MVAKFSLNIKGEKVDKNSLTSPGKRIQGKKNSTARPGNDSS